MEPSISHKTRTEIQRVAGQIQIFPGDIARKRKGESGGGDRKVTLVGVEAHGKLDCPEICR
jgi:hypothetical protein